MIRIIVRTVDIGPASHVGGPVTVAHRTFDIEVPSVLEEFLRSVPDLATREIVGFEVLPS